MTKHGCLHLQESLFILSVLGLFVDLGPDLKVLARIQETTVHRIIQFVGSLSNAFYFLGIFHPSLADVRRRFHFANELCPSMNANAERSCDCQ